MNQSIWKATAAETAFPALNRDTQVDVAIVGGGITGITSAYLLAKSGKSVAVLESRELAGGTTGDATGNLYTMVDKRLHHIQTKWDKETAQIVAEGRTAAMELVETLAQRHQIDCNFKRVPWYLFSETDKKDTTIEKESRALNEYGLTVEELEELPLPIKVSKAIRVQNQAQFNPAAFVRGLAKVMDPQRVEIFENTPVLKIEKEDQLRLSTPNGQVKAKKVILATHIPKGIYPLHTALYPYREYALAMKLNSGDYPEGIFWDTEAKNHHSIRSYKTKEGHFLLVVGGHHKVGQSEQYDHFYKDLEQSVRRHFDVGSIDFKWSAQHYKPADGLPYIGESTDDNVYLATGFSTDGLTYGVLSAIILDDTLNGRENRWAKTFDAGRFTPVKSAKNFVKENVNVAKQFIKNIPGQSDGEFFSEIKADEGKVVEMDAEKWAVYRDVQGNLHCLSAVCTHMKCIVDWNDSEKSWDCPCHGSRFQVSGEVIEGPAFDPLEKKQE